MKKIFSVLTLGVITTLLSGSLLLAAPAYAADPTGAKSDVCAGIGLASSNGNCGDSGAAANKAISAAISIMSIFVGVAAVIMIIVAGLKFITSGGDTTKVASAKNSVIYAIVGLVVVVLAQMIVHFVLTKVK